MIDYIIPILESFAPMWDYALYIVMALYFVLFVFSFIPWLIKR